MPEKAFLIMSGMRGGGWTHGVLDLLRSGNDWIDDARGSNADDDTGEGGRAGDGLGTRRGESADMIMHLKRVLRLKMLLMAGRITREYRCSSPAAREVAGRSKWIRPKW